jgi:type II secretory pathway component PulJ
MKVLKKKYPAFTVMELMIVMLLAVLTISMSFQTYEMFSKLFMKYKKHADRMTELTTFQRVLSGDIYKSVTVEKTEKGIRCDMGDSKVEYYWEENYILRNSLKQDTFHLGVLNHSCEYESHEQYTSRAPVDYCHLLLRSDQDSIPLNFTKSYGVDQRLLFREKHGYQKN